MLGERIKKAVESSGKSLEEVALAADMSVANLFKIYKKDSTETKYLLGICNLLGVDMNYFFQDQLKGSYYNTGQSNYASKVGSNQQTISIGSGDLQKQLDDCEKERDLLRKAVADKELIIELLQGKKEKK